MKKGKSKKVHSAPEETGEQTVSETEVPEAEVTETEGSEEARLEAAPEEERLEEINPMDEPSSEPMPPEADSGEESISEPEEEAAEEDASAENDTRAAQFRRLWSEELGGARLRAGRLWGRVRNKNYVRPQKGQVRQLIRRRFTYQELVGVFLALCPLVGVTVSAADGLAAGLLSTLTVLGSVFIIEVFRRILPDGIGSMGHMILVAGFTTALTLILQAFQPMLVEELGIYLSMTVVSCLALERQVSPSRKQGSLFLLMDSVITGLSFTLMLTAVSLLREFLGSGALFGVPVLGGVIPLSIMAGPFGGFFCLGCVAALAQGLQPRRKPSAERRRKA